MSSRYTSRNIYFFLQKLEEKKLLPSDFLEFVKLHTGGLSIYEFKPKEIESIGLAIRINEEVYIFDGFLSPEELEIEVEYNCESDGLLKFANNSINEGGYYIGIAESNRGKVYFYEDYVESAADEEIILLSNTFSDFLGKLTPVGLIYHDSHIEYKFLYDLLDAKGNLIGLSLYPIA